MHWPTARLGLAVAAALGGLWLLLPSRAPAAEGVAADVLGCVDLALERDEPTLLGGCRDMLRSGLHHDLLGRRLPGLLRVIDALARVDRRCDAAQGDAFQRGICALRQRRSGDALRLFGALPPQHGGVAFREVAAGLMRLEQARRGDGMMAP